MGVVGLSTMEKTMDTVKEVLLELQKKTGKLYTLCAEFDASSWNWRGGYSDATAGDKLLFVRAYECHDYGTWDLALEFLTPSGKIVTLGAKSNNPANYCRFIDLF